MSDALYFHYQHARERAQERYGFHLTPGEWERLNWMIFRETVECRFIHVKNEETTVYDVTFAPGARRKRILRVYFSETHYCVTTLIPIETDYEIVNSWSDLLRRRRFIRYEWGKAQAAKEEALGQIVHTPTPVSPEPIIPPRKTAELVEATEAKALTTISDLNAEAVATRLWAGIVGVDYVAKTKVAKKLAKALLKEAERSKPTIVNYAAKNRRSDTEIVQSVAGKSLSKLKSAMFYICDLPMPVGVVFQIAEQDGHPMRSACRDFLAKHRLYLRSEVTGARGRPTIFVMQREAA